MKALLKELNQLLAEKASILNQFIVLLQKEWHQIVAYSMDSLEEIIKQKELLVRQIQSMDEQREKIVESIADKIEIPAEDLTLNKIANLPGNPWKKQMAARRDQLRGQVGTISKLNETNRNLINQSSLSMKKSMAFVFQLAEKDRASYYSNGRVLEAKIESKMLSTDI